MSEYVSGRGALGETGEARPIGAPAGSLELRLQRAETLNRIATEVRYDQPLEDVLDALAENVVAETNAIACGVMLLDPADLGGRAFGSFNLPDGYIETMARLRQGSVQETYLRESLAANRSWVLRDAVSYLLTRPEYESAKDLIRTVPYHTLVGTPFFNRPDLIGLVYIYYPETVEVDDGEIAFARAIAERASPVMDNAWLFNQSQRRTAELEALSKADRALHEAVHLDEVYQALIDLAVDLFGADRSLFLAFDEQDRLHAYATRGVSEGNLMELQEVYHGIGRERFAGRGPELTVSEDIPNDPRMDPGVRRVTPSLSVVDVPVFVDGAFYGLFVLGYLARRAFSPGERSLFETLAVRAGLAIHKAVLFRQSERRTNELEALYRADEALHRSLHLQDVLDAMVDLAVELLGADSSAVVTWQDDETLAIVASRGISPRLIEAVDRSYKRFNRDHFKEFSAPFQMGVVENTFTSPSLDPLLRGAAPGSFVEIPVVVEGAIWGLFPIAWTHVRSFTDADRRMFGAFAARASLAIQNALLFRESSRRTNELEALYRADEALHRSLRREDVLEAMVELALELLGADSSLVATAGEDGRMQVVACRGLPQELVDEIHLSYGRGDASRWRDARPEMALVEDVEGDPDVDPGLRGSVLGSYAEIPVFVEDRPWGVFSVGWQSPRKFGEDDRQLFDAFAARAGLAVQNALLFEQAQTAASMEERQRIARELHDSVSQALYGIGLGARTARRRLGDNAPAEVVEPVDYIVQLAESGLAETRALIFELVPESLEQQGLVLALQRQAAATQSRFRVQVSAYLAEEPDIPVRAKEALYRICQESLHNMAKHAHASQASVTLSCGDGAVSLVIEDDGLGFDTGEEFPGHLGLKSMAERARRVGGECRIESTPGKGTRVSVALPA